ncbi:MAG TPA: diguanylate cyclase [Noviherbaspirillum sp.]
MQDKKKTEQSPADIAREAFKRLATRRIAPTPDAYKEIYEEIAGNADQPSPEKVLSRFASDLAGISDDMARLAADCTRALEAKDWKLYSERLDELVTRHLKQAGKNIAAEKSAGTDTTPSARQGIPLVDTPQPAPLKSAGTPLVDPVAPPVLKSSGISLVDAAEPPPLKSAGMRLVEDSGLVATVPAAASAQAAEPLPSRTSKPAAERLETESVQARMLRDLLVRTLTLAVASLLHNAPDLARESEEIAASAREANTEPALNDVSSRLKQFCFRLELKAADMAEEHELLLRLFRLLLENISELLDDDSWLSGQIASVQELISGPLSHAALLDATRSLKEVIYKQGLLKHSLSEAKVSMKNMMITFIDRLGAVAASTGSYHEKISGYADKISKAQGIPELNRILENVMHDTKLAQTEALRSRDEMIAARQDVQAAENRIQELEKQLEEMSELVREDQLTGSLNRRGLDDVFEREFARSERRNSPLCIALLDLDDFKRLNDTYGHTAGDEALIHLVRVVKDTLRTMDVIGRFGGEEFLIVLPDTPMEEAAQTVTRVQRELTKRIFMHNNEKLLITFSAGVALRKPGEEPTALIQRADAALYKAKRAGKNRVVPAE